MKHDALGVFCILAIAGVVSAGAQTPSDNGYTGPASQRKTPSADVMANQWYEFTWSGVGWCVGTGGCNANIQDPGASPWTFTVPAGQSVDLVVCDGFNSGDSFTVYDNGNPIVSTPVVAQGASLDCDPEGCATNPLFSNATVELGAGNHSITIYTDTDPFGGGAAFFKIQSEKAAAQVFLRNLAQTYDGTARTITATTMPAGLTVEFTYDGNAWAPTNAGSYAVTGTINDVIYQGSAAGTLTVAKADQDIENFLPADGEMFDLGETAAISATASSGLAVEFANLTPSLATLAGTDITFIKPGLTQVQASQAGDANWNPATLVHGWRVMNSQNAMCDFDGDGAADIAVYDPMSGNWYIRYSLPAKFRPSEQVVQWGWPEGLPVPGDYDGDGRTDVAVYHPSSGNWFMACSTVGAQQAQWGWPAAVPVPGDYDGDGATDVAVYDPILMNWHLRMSAAGDQTVAWGLSNSVPAPADYDGDGVTDLATYRPATGTWSIRYSLPVLPVKSRSAKQTVPWGWSETVQWGWSEAVPVPGDYDGDGAADIAVFHRETGNWYLLCSTAGIRIEEWGWSATAPVPADYNGDGVADILVYHQAAGDWYVLGSEPGLPLGIVPFGWSAARPVLLQPLIHAWFGLP